MATSAADKLKNISEADRKQIREAEEMLGPDPETMGLVKNFFWGNIREELAFPYPQIGAEETARCDQLLAELDEYLRNEHPAIQIDQEQEIPRWVIDRLFSMGVLGMTIPKEYGGGGFGITSYNRVLSRIGESCGSTAVLVSAHQSIGCKAVMLFGTEEQKKHWLPKMAREMLSAFCLSEPNVGCDAGGQETRCELSDDGSHYILNGEKKWATSGALSGMFTVMCKQRLVDPKTGKEKDKVTALLCTPDMDGIDIFSRNRSKNGIRGTWQARIRFNEVKVPKENLLHKEGRGLNVALSCLNYGRCTLSAGMLGGARTAYLQAAKWAQTRYQFDRPIGDFELVQDYLAKMASNVYAMESVLYLTTGMLDRADDDIMLETALCKVFCSEWGYQTVDHAVQIMGGESQMTENEIERIWRDSRLNTIVEGANEVMHSFVFAYGSKQLGESMMAVKDNATNPKFWGRGMKLGAELFLGFREPAPSVTKLSPQLIELQTIYENGIREHSHQVKLAMKDHEEQIITRQLVQRRLSLNAMWLYAMTAVLGRLDQAVRGGKDGDELDYELKIATYFIKRADREIQNNIHELRHNCDESTRSAAAAVRKFIDSRPNSDFIIPEASPSAKGTGRQPDQSAIKQFGSGSIAVEANESANA
ncbi:MAG: acyl-CoA dehydrogenase family protein [Phycisphaerales bacterium]